jgi:hypothetical protein
MAMTNCLSGRVLLAPSARCRRNSPFHVAARQPRLVTRAAADQTNAGYTACCDMCISQRCSAVMVVHAGIWAMLTNHAVPAPRRREVLLKSFNVGVLAALFNFGAVARPDGLGIQVRDDVLLR